MNKNRDWIVVSFKEAALYFYDQFHNSDRVPDNSTSELFLFTATFFLCQRYYQCRLYTLCHFVNTSCSVTIILRLYF